MVQRYEKYLRLPNICTCFYVLGRIWEICQKCQKSAQTWQICISLQISDLWWYLPNLPKWDCQKPRNSKNFPSKIESPFNVKIPYPKEFVIFICGAPHHFGINRNNPLNFRKKDDGKKWGRFVVIFLTNSFISFLKFFSCARFIFRKIEIFWQIYSQVAENENEKSKNYLAEPRQNRGRWMAERENRDIFRF